MRKIHIHGGRLSSARELAYENVDGFAPILNQLLDIPVINQAQLSANNEDIFLRACVSLVESDADTIIIEWASTSKTTVVPELGKVLAVECGDTVYNQYVKLSQYIPILNSLAARLNKRVFYWTTVLPIYHEFNQLPGSSGYTTDNFSNYSKDARAMVDPSGTSSTAQMSARASSIKALMLAINSNPTAWIDTKLDLTDIATAEQLHRAMALKINETIKDL